MVEHLEIISQTRGVDHIGWSSRSKSKDDGLNSTIILVLRWVMGPESNSSMTHGVVKGHSRKLIQTSIV